MLNPAKHMHRIVKELTNHICESNPVRHHGQTPRPVTDSAFTQQVILEPTKFSYGIGISFFFEIAFATELAVEWRAHGRFAGGT